MQLNIIQNPAGKKRKGLSHTPRSFKNFYQSLRLNHIKSQVSDKEAAKGAFNPKPKKLNKDIPIYEIVLNGITMDVSNSFKYIREMYDKLNKGQKDAIIYKMESGFKSVYFTAKNLTPKLIH